MYQNWFGFITIYIFLDFNLNVSKAEGKNQGDIAELRKDRSRMLKEDYIEERQENEPNLAKQTKSPSPVDVFPLYICPKPACRRWGRCVGGRETGYFPPVHS